jgi:hypothetical protein
MVCVVELKEIGRATSGEPDLSDAGMKALMLLEPRPDWFPIPQFHSN